MSRRKTEPTWLENMPLLPRLLVHLASAQSRFESAIVSRFRVRFAERDIRRALRELANDKLIDLDALDRVRWKLTIAGLNAAARARAVAKRKAAA